MALALAVLAVPIPFLESAPEVAPTPKLQAPNMALALASAGVAAQVPTLESVPVEVPIPKHHTPS